MRIHLISFTDRGEELANRLARELGGAAERHVLASEWTKRHFHDSDALVFVGAAGIAVRSVAPYLKGKAEDPAVVVVDETARYAIPVLSGHLGGANDLARRISGICGAEAVITTATDAEGRFAVDEWARRQNLCVCEPERILPVSSAILRGETVTVTSGWPIEGACPPGVRLGEDGAVRVTLKDDGKPALHLVPRVSVLGIGCRKGTSVETIEGVFRDFYECYRLHVKSITEVCSIDVKAEEPGLLAFCRNHGWDFRTFTAEELARVQGEFDSSDFVAAHVGVDNVCERAAALGSGGTVLCRRFVENGVTMAAALRPFRLDWRWQYG